MKVFLTLFVIFCFYVQTKASIVIELPNNERKEGGCYNEKLGHLIANEIKKTEDCGQAQCNSDGSIQYLDCGAVASTDTECKLVTDNTKPYPQCCPKCE